jgi:hypothetical protein
VDGGPYEVTREFALHSLAKEASKVWICEWLITEVGGRNELQPFGDAKLQIERWTPAGLRAPCGSWLDFKGGFVDEVGVVTPTKDRNERAKDIHDTGWT